jgi:hypothetical protein
MIYLEKIAILLIISLLDVLITITTSSTMMLLLIDYGIDKYTSLILSMILSLLILAYIKFNHKIRNYLLSQEGDQ